MFLEKLVEHYIGAWNRQDVEGLLALMHDGAAYYDSFWRETCVGRDLVHYFRDSFEDYAYFYSLVGDVIETSSGAAFRYNARERSEQKNVDPVFNGVEVLTVRDGKILTVSNHYCDPREDCIQELADLEAARHGQSRYAKSGLPIHRLSLIKGKIFSAMIQDKLSLNPAMTILQLADQVGCSNEQLLEVVSIECRADIHDHSARNKSQYARDKAREEFNENVDLSQLAANSGFKSFEDFCNVFNETFIEAPMRRDRRRTKIVESKTNLD